MSISILNPHRRPLAKDGIIYDSGKGFGAIPDSVTAATLAPILVASGLRLYALPRQGRVVEARPFKL